MSRRLLATVLVVGMMLVWTAAARAQMFGERKFGSSLSASRSRTGSSTAASASAGKAGSATAGSDVRGNRDPNDFVGGGARGFVGRGQALDPSQVRSAVDGLKVEKGPNANQTGALQPSRIGMYEPRLKVGFNLPAARPQERVSGLQGKLASSSSIRWTGPCEVSVEGRTATLRGTVASDRERRLAELFALFEPGISQVHNEIQVLSSTPSPSPSDSPAPAPSAP